MPMITEPYIYEGKMVMEHAYPIVINDEFKGMVGIDRSLDHILEFVQDIKDRENVDIFLISRMGSFISATSNNSEQLITKAIKDTVYKDLFSRYHTEKTHDLLELVDDPLDQQKYYFGTAFVPTGEWTVVVRKSEKAVLRPIRYELYLELGFALVGLLVITFLSFRLARSISKRIRKAAEAADFLASGGLSKEVDLEKKVNDEIGQMNQSFNKVMAVFGELTDVCVSISEGDFSKRVDVKSDRDILSEAINKMSIKRKDAEEELKLAQQKSEAANKAKSVFIASMSHEIRTPLNAIMGYSQILERTEGLTNQQKDDVIAIHRSGKHLLSIVNDILDFSKIEAGKMELHRCDFNLNNLIQDMFIIFTMRSQEKGLQLIIEGLEENEKILVHSDSVKLRQILVNLIGNALKFTDSGSITLTINAYENDNYYFEVRDTGVGIPIEKQASIFKAFQQDEEGIKQGGTGLGLSISKTLLQLLGSDLLMKSVLGQGSRFYFTVKLPPSQVLEEVVNNPYTKVSQLAVGNTIKAVLIDDVQENLDVLARVLQEVGVECKVADNGLEGLTLINEFSPNIVFSDYHMAGMDGLEVTQRIRKNDGNKNIKVVMVSASVFSHHQKMYREEGVDGFIGKPFVREEVFEILAQLLNVEYEYDNVADRRPKEQRSLGLDISSVSLHQELLNDIKDAAQLGRVSKVNELLDYLENEKLIATSLIQHLKDLSDELDFDSIFDIVSKIKASDE